MSLSFSVPFGDMLIMSADGRGLITDGEKDVVGTNSLKKIHTINDKFIIFGCGLQNVNDRAINKIKQLVERRNITQWDDFEPIVTNCCREEFKDFIKRNLNSKEILEGNTVLNLTITTWDTKKQTFVTAIFTNNNNYIPEISEKIIINGNQHRLALKLFSKHLQKVTGLGSLIHLIKDVYREIEKYHIGVGGELTFYLLNPSTGVSEINVGNGTSNMLDYRVNEVNIEDIEPIPANEDYQATHSDGTFTQMSDDGFYRIMKSTSESQVYDYNYIVGQTQLHVINGQDVVVGPCTLKNLSSQTMQNEIIWIDAVYYADDPSERQLGLKYPLTINMPIGSSVKQDFVSHKPYFYLSFMGTATITHSADTRSPDVQIRLPAMFKGKDFQVVAGVREFNTYNACSTASVYTYNVDRTNGTFMLNAYARYAITTYRRVQLADGTSELMLMWADDWDYGNIDIWYYVWA